MARVRLRARAALGGLASLYSQEEGNPANVTMTAANTSDKQQTAHTGKVLILAHNSGASPHTVTITSTPDHLGRTGDLTAYSIGAGEYAVFGPFKLEGWVQTDGKLYFEANHAEVLFGVIDLSNS